MQRAKHLREQSHEVITFSPKVFIPLTRLCRDACGYCTFAQPPLPGRRAYMTLEEVLQVARLGAQQGCTEALFTLGDKPELLYQEAADELQAMGLASTLDYVKVAAEAVLRETGLLPHVNAGVMGVEELSMLRKVSASQGLMLESLSEALLAPGGPHHNCPDKDPKQRLATLEAAGRAAVPMTTGILIGIGETRQDRVEALVAIRRLHEQHGHIQEVIIQNFRAKKNTAMEACPEPSLEELLGTCAMARLILGPRMSIQAPPNLTPANGQTEEELARSWRALLDAGINDWGGISPITRDFVNPERKWPHLLPLAEATVAAGKLLVPRLPVYQEYLGQADKWLDHTGGGASVGAAVRRAADSSGLVRGSTWCAGLLGPDDASAQEATQQEAAAAHWSGAALDSTEATNFVTPDGTARLRGAGSSGGSDSSSSSSSGGGGGGGGTSASSRAATTEHRIDTSSTSSTSISNDTGTATTSGRGSSCVTGGLRSSTPLPRLRLSSTWGVELDTSGSLKGFPRPPPCKHLASLLEAVLRDGHQLSEAEIAQLLRARGADFHAVCTATDELRQRVNGDMVSYVVNRNINYTNVCTYGCRFCAFSKGKSQEGLRGPAYLVPLEEIARRTAEAWDRGATEVCMQGGIHPDFTGETYLAILRAAKEAAPAVHVHAFSPLEVQQGAATLGLPVKQYLRQLKEAGLGSLPGTAAEVLDDEVRRVLCPDKLTTAEWLEVVEAAHEVGLRTTSTLMFGHVEGVESWAHHLVALRGVQERTGGITEFVPLPFVHMEAPIYLKGGARKGPTLRECLLLHAVARLALHPHITNIQASWVKMGPLQAAALLAAGCNDMGGSIMNESITRAAGASHGQELPPERMEAIIRAAGRTPRQRTTLYGDAPPSQAAKSFGAQPLAQVLTAASSAGTTTASTLR